MKLGRGSDGGFPGASGGGNRVPRGTSALRRNARRLLRCPVRLALGARPVHYRQLPRPAATTWPVTLWVSYSAGIPEGHRALEGPMVATAPVPSLGDGAPAPGDPPDWNG